MNIKGFPYKKLEQFCDDNNIKITIKDFSDLHYMRMEFVHTPNEKRIIRFVDKKFSSEEQTYIISSLRNAFGIPESTRQYYWHFDIPSYLDCVSEIKKVIFNDPATIVMWNDGTKTVVKCGEGDIFDPEKGLAMAISKKALGNKGRYYEEFKKWLPEKESNLYSDISKAIAKGYEEGIKRVEYTLLNGDGREPKGLVNSMEAMISRDNLIS